MFKPMKKIKEDLKLDGLSGKVLEEMAEITLYVEMYRYKCDITPTPGHKFEQSCFGFGEGHNYLYRQLALRPNSDDSWTFLYEDDEIRHLVLETVRNERGTVKPKNYNPKPMCKQKCPK